MFSAFCARFDLCFLHFVQGLIYVFCILCKVWFMFSAFCARFDLFSAFCARFDLCFLHFVQGLIYVFCILCKVWLYKNWWFGMSKHKNECGKMTGFDCRRQIFIIIKFWHFLDEDFMKVPYLYIYTHTHTHQSTRPLYTKVSYLYYKKYHTSLYQSTIPVHSTHNR